MKSWITLHFPDGRETCFPESRIMGFEQQVFANPVAATPTIFTAVIINRWPEPAPVVIAVKESIEEIKNKLQMSSMFS